MRFKHEDLQSRLLEKTQKLRYQQEKEKLDLADIKRLKEENKKFTSRFTVLNNQLSEFKETSKELKLTKKKLDLQVKDLKHECNKLEDRAERAENKNKEYSSKLVRKGVMYNELSGELKAL